MFFTALFPALLLAQAERPNIMIIMVDDMGYSDPGCYGGDVMTPNIDALADNGLRFTQFYNCSRCCPTRASLLTGMYAQQVGLRFNGRSLTTNCVTIAEVLKDAGYNTGMAGKWHLSETKEKGSREAQMKWLAHQDPDSIFAPLPSYPCNRGFDEHWGLIWGVADFFDPFSLVHNETAIKTVPDDFYMTTFIGEKSVELIDTFSKENDPFFMYVAFTAPHWPLHALPEDVAKYQGKYDMGWDSLRIKRYNRMVEMGLIDPARVKNAPNESHRSWESETRKNWEADHMEVHAAMVDRVDQEIGRIIDKLKETGKYENTVIFFLSDNGMSPERYRDYGFDRPQYTRENVMHLYPGQDYVMDGSQVNYSGVGDAWAGACNTPYRYWKAESYFGGNATPMVVNWPNGLKTQPGSITSQAGHVMDIMPTCLELAGATYPETYKGNVIQPIEGKSLTAIFNGGTRQRDTLYWEHENGRAIRVGNWKMVALRSSNTWYLYDLSTDLTETQNVAIEHPDIVKQLSELWNAWARKVGVDVPDIPEPTPKGLSFCFPFNGDFNDRSPNKYILDNPFSVTFSEGKYGQAAEFNGSNQYLDLNTQGIINPQTTQFTVCAWVNNSSTFVPDPGSIYEEIVLAQKNGTSDQAGRIALYSRIDEQGNFRFNNFLGARANLSSPGTFVRNEWVHVAVVCDPVTSVVAYYINGEKDTTIEAAQFENCTGGFRIGGHKLNKDYWNGKIDELFVYKGILSKDDIKDVMDNKITFPASHEPLQAENQVVVFYDRISKVLFVKCEYPVYSVKMYAASGQEIASETNKNEINTSGLPVGAYIVKVQAENGVTVSKRVIIT